MDPAARESVAEDKRAPDVTTMNSIAIMHKHVARPCLVRRAAGFDFIVSKLVHVIGFEEFCCWQAATANNMYVKTMVHPKVRALNRPADRHWSIESGPAPPNTSATKLAR